MKKFLLYMIALIILFFLIPILATVKFKTKEVISKEVIKQEENLIMENIKK